MPLWPAFLAAGLACAAAAEPAVKVEPGTAQPRSGAWQADYRERVEAVFRNLMAHSGYDGPHWLSVEKRTPTQLVYVDKFNSIEGSPAVSMAAHTNPNKTGHAIVAVTYGLLDIARDEPELAAILGHEIAHLVLKHPEAAVAERGKAFDAWSKDQDWGAFASNEAALAAFSRDTEKRLQAFQRGLEADADSYGLELAGLSGYDKRAAEPAMLHAKDWLWALGAAETPTHDPLKMRAARLRRLAAESDGRAADVAAGGSQTLGGQ